MTSSLQTILAFAIVTAAAAWLVWNALRKKKSGCSGGDCGALRPEVKKLQAKLKR